MAKEFFVHNRDFYKSFFGMTIVIALQNAIVFAVNLADAIMLSRYSETALSGVALLNQVQFLLQMMVFGIASRPAVGDRKISAPFMRLSTSHLNSALQPELL